MLSDSAARHATAAAQGLMRGFGINIAADGIWSTLTQSAYSRLTGDQAARVNAVMGAAAPGASARALDEYREAQRASGIAAQASAKATSKLDTAAIKKLITGIALEEGVPPTAALKFASVESKFDPNAASRNDKGGVIAAGLFQLTKDAIDQIGLPPPNGNKFDPEWNTRVGVRYMKWVARYLNTTFDDVGAIYAGYNLGVGNVEKLKSGKFNDPKVATALSWQANALKKGGAKQYLANADKFVNSAVV